MQSAKMKADYEKQKRIQQDVEEERRVLEEIAILN